MEVYRHTSFVSGLTRARVPLLLVAILCGSLGFLAWTPYILTMIDNPSRDWVRLGGIAQTYAGASAMLSAAAILGVALSLVLQAREIKINRRQSQRALHIELFILALQEPELLKCWALDESHSVEPERLRQIVYTNLIFSHWEMLYGLGDMSEENVRRQSAMLLAGPIGREYWRFRRGRNPLGGDTRSDRRFSRIVEDEYQRAARDAERRQRESTETRPREHTIDDEAGHSHVGEP